MTNQLKECLETVTCGKQTKGWPGKDTLQNLKAWGVCFKIEPKAVNLSIKDLCMPTKNINAGKSQDINDKEEEDKDVFDDFGL
ncbi:hypothetical protein PCANC_06370 [Puccinia coronata f. sp. avenae]|nr:hypothetical protein PCANC_06370 [Puccinia coronata f. sp. avenae]